MSMLEKVLDFIIPRKCAGCLAPSETFCNACFTLSYSDRTACLFCGQRNLTGAVCQACKQRVKTPLSSVFWAGRYDDKLKKAIWELKYGKRSEMAKPLGQMLAKKFFEAVGSSLPSQQFAGHGYFFAKKFLVLAPSRSQVPANCSPEASPKSNPLTDFLKQKVSILGDLAQRGGASRAIRQQANMRVNQNAIPFAIIPIPLHFKKEHERGFNQAALLADEFGKLTNIPVLKKLLIKTRETEEQVKVQDKKLRLENLENAFAVRTPIPKTTIILVDDVATSGATLTHAARALKDAGAKKIIGLVIAHG